MIAIISDIHGNYPALSAVLQEIDKMKCSQILSLGDVCGYYCMVNECIEELRKRSVVNILGNHDSYILGYGACPRSTTVNDCIEYQKQNITSDNLEYVANSIELSDTEHFSARHGGWINPLDEYISTFDFNIAANYPCKLFCSGHTHIQNMQKQNEITYFNPGSVGQPRDGDPRSAFAVIDGDDVKLFRVKYDINSIAEKMKSTGFEERIYSCLYEGQRIKTYGS